MQVQRPPNGSCHFTHGCQAGNLNFPVQHKLTLVSLFDSHVIVAHPSPGGEEGLLLPKIQSDFSGPKNQNHNQSQSTLTLDSFVGSQHKNSHLLQCHCTFQPLEKKRRILSKKTSRQVLLTDPIVALLLCVYYFCFIAPTIVFTREEAKVWPMVGGCTGAHCIRRELMELVFGTLGATA